MGKFYEGLADELTLFVRQLGWLHATPEPTKASRGEPDQRSRMQRLKDAGAQPELPEVSAGYLLDYLMEIGPAASGGMGPVPVTHGEIRSWQENTGIELSPWEARLLRSLSREYVSELVEAGDPKRKAPYDAAEVDAAKVVANDMRAALRRMGAAAGRPASDK